MTSPFILLNLASLLDTLWRFGSFFDVGSRGSLGGPNGNPLMYYIFSSLYYGLGLPLELLALAGLLYLVMEVIRERRSEEICLVSFVLFYILVFSRLHFSVHRYIIPILPFLLLAAAKLLLRLLDFFSRERHRDAILWGAASLCVVLPVRDAVYYDWLISTQKDTRTQAKEWIEANIPSGTGIAVENFVRIPAFQPPLKEDTEENRQKLQATLESTPHRGEYRKLLLKVGMEGKQYRIIDLIETPHLVSDYENYYDFEKLKEQDVHFVILNHLYRRPFLDVTKVKEKRRQFEEKLKQQALLVKRFTPLRGEKRWRFVNHESTITPFDAVLDFVSPGPELEMYQLK